MRYTRWNDEWGRYTVPLLTKEDGSKIMLGIFTEREERLHQPHDNIVIVPQTEHIFGEFIDRLAELENKIEFGGLVEVRRGEWIKDCDTLVHCSVCKVARNNYFGVGGNLWHYCPNCGAKMDGKEESG